jgi:ankyrin repeat protein
MEMDTWLCEANFEKKIKNCKYADFFLFCVPFRSRLNAKFEFCRPLLLVVHFLTFWCIESKSKSKSKSAFAVSGECREIACRLFKSSNNGAADVQAELASITRAALSVALCDAARACNITAIDALVGAGADARADVDAGLDAPLALAAGVQYGDNVLDVMRRLIAMGACVDGEGLEHVSPMSAALACDFDADDRVLLLLNAGADPRRRDSLGRSVLHYCAASGKLEWFARFARMGVDVRACANDGASVMHVAAGSSCCNADGIRAIAGFGADLQALDAKGENALLKAITKEWFDVGVAAALVELGVDVRVVDVNGENALHRVMRHTADSSPTDLVRTLVVRGLDVNCRATDGNTPLLLLVEHDSFHSE